MANDLHQNEICLPGVIYSAFESSSVNWSLPASLSLCFNLFKATSQGRFSQFSRHWWPVSFLASHFFKQITNCFPLKRPVTEILMCLKFSKPRGYMFGYRQDQSFCYSSYLQSYIPHSKLTVLNVLSVSHTGLLKMHSVWSSHQPLFSTNGGADGFQCMALAEFVVMNLINPLKH